MRDTVVSGRPHARRVVGVNALETPGSADFVLRAEIVVELRVELISSIGNAKTETILTTDRTFQPARARGVESIADFPVGDGRHDAEHLLDVSGRIKSAS